MAEALEIQQIPLWDKLQGKHVPLSFDLEITARCNNDCRHCYINLPANDRSAREQELSVAEIGQIADQAVNLGALWCLVTGGEPLLRLDFAEIYLLLKRKGLLVSVFTNATLVNAEHIALFKKYPPRDIEVTVYGASAETYERVTRQPGSFARFLRGLDLLQENGIPVRLKAMALRANLAEMEAITRFCQARTKDYIRFDPVLHLRYDGDPARNADIRAERLSPDEIVALERADPQRFQALQNRCDELISPQAAHNNSNHLFHCGVGLGSFNVGYDGKFRLCSSLYVPGTTYDLRQGSLAEAWRKLVPTVRDMRSDRPEFLETCRRCELTNLCLGCPAHAYLETGAMDGSTPYFCAVAHARAAMLNSTKGQQSQA